MNPKKIWANLAISDLDRTAKFYAALGFKPNGSHRSKELTSFLVGEGDFVINFFLKDVLQKNVKGKYPIRKLPMKWSLRFLLKAKARRTTGKKRFKTQAGKSFPDQKNLEWDIMGLFLQIRMDIGLMSFIWMGFNNTIRGAIITMRTSFRCIAMKARPVV